MSQALQVCPSSVHVCAARVTRLNSDGTVTAGPNNAYVTNNIQQLTMTPDMLAGDSKQIVNGCDCIGASYRGNDKLMRWNLELDISALEMPLISMMIGASNILDSSSVPVVKGLWWPEQNSCASPVPPKVAIEVWSDMWENDDVLINADSNGDSLRYLHWLFLSSSWHLDAATLQNDFLLPKLVGFTRSNTVWGMGPYGDQPETAQPAGGVWMDKHIPTAACGYITASS